MSNAAEKQTVSDAPPPAKPLAAEPPGCLGRLRQITSVVFGLLIVACVGGIIFVRLRAEVIGFDIANVGAFLLTLLALVALIPSILLRTKIKLFSRLMAVTVVVLVICAPLATLRIDGFDGRLLPILHWRWEPKPAPLESKPVVAANGKEVDLATRTPDDFSQFLGSDRNLDLPATYLEHDWETHPPELVWRIPIGAGWSGFSVVNGFAVTMEQRGTAEIVTCYSVEDGALLWARSHMARHETVMGGLGPRSSPTIDEGFVYTLGATGLLQCINGTNGALVWSDDLLQRCGVTADEDLAAISWGRAASPLIVGDLVIVPLGGPYSGPFHSLAAYDKKTGELRWLGGDQQIGYASPTLVSLCGLDQILIVNESSVSGHRLEDGSVIWMHPWEGRSNAEANCSQAVVLPNDQVLLTNRRKCELVQLAPAANDELQAESIWLGRNKLKTKFTNVVARDGFVYGLSDGILECLELQTGKRRWKDRKGDYGHGQILGVGDVILVQAESGEVVMVEFNPVDRVELGRLNALSERTWNTLCLYGSLLLVRNASEAACYRLPLRNPESEK